MSRVGAQVQVSAVSFLIQLPANGVVKTVKDGPSVWAPNTHMGDPDEHPGSWL